MSPSQTYRNPGRTKSTIVRLSRLPMPRKNPSCEIMPWWDTKPSSRPTTIIALPEVDTESVTALTVRMTASRLGSVARNSV